MLLVSRKLTKFICISFSNILEKCDNIDIGLQLEAISLAPDLKMGITLASFNLSGKIPFCTQLLNISAK